MIDDTDDRSVDFAWFPVGKIWVDRAGRQRRELKNIPELAASIQRIGRLLHPIVIQRDGELRVGERRWEAVKLLGWDKIPVTFIEDMDEAERQLVELEENIARVNIEWAEECLAVHKYHSLRVRRDPEWTKSMTADALGMSGQNLGQKLDVAEELIKGNTRVLEAPKFSTARNVVARVKQRAAANAIAAVLPEPPPERTVPLLNEDFREWSAAYTGRPFNFLHCDFPYGVGADKHAQGQAAEMGGYSDTPEVYFDLLDTLSRNMDGLVAASAHMMFWYSMDYYQLTFDALTKMGWRVNPFPLIWYKNDNTGILPDPERGPRRNYETCFLASRGDRKLTARGAVSNVCAWPGRDKEIHMSEKPVGMLKHFMGMLVDEYSIVLDPTCGSGNALKAATSLGASTVLGLERDTEFYNRAKEAYFDE